MDDVHEIASPDSQPKTAEALPDDIAAAEAPPDPFTTINGRLTLLEQNITEMQTSLQEVLTRLDLLPRQMRQIGSKVDNITESVSDPRLRDILNNCLLLYDLVGQMKQSIAMNSESDRLFQVLQDQISQLLQTNGLTLIAEADWFDPALHKAVETVACETQAEHGQIVELYRPGFRTSQSVFRYAEVAIKQYVNPALEEKGE